ncbi:MAG: DUF1501 domain-containing protein [Bacteroidota bacterium]
MKRRDFFKIAAPLAAAPILVNGLPVRTFATTSMLGAINCDATDRVMVMVYLNGANDFINTFVPLNQHATYAGHRPNMHIPTANLITLDSTLPTTQQLGLHPALTGMKALYDNGKLKVVQGVGMPSPNRSHFKAQDLWLSGGDGTNSIMSNLETGWIGRFLDNRYPYYEGIPFTNEPDPLGILLGSMDNAGFHPPHQHRFEINLSGQDPSGYYSLISSIGGLPITNFPNSEHGDMLQYIMGVENSVNVFAQTITNTFNAGANAGSVAYPNNDLADQLRTVARMLSGGSRTKVFMTTQGGYDTHAFQVDQGNALVGRHTDLLTDLDTALKAFQDDLDALGLSDKVMTVVFSEFGRKIVENGNYGLDHGTLGSMILIGNGVEGGVTGNNLDLNALDSQNAPDPSTMQHDYRQVFGTILQDWMGGNDDAIAATFLTSTYIQPKLNLVGNGASVDPNCFLGAKDVQISARVFLQGNLDLGTSTMKDDLRMAGTIPTEEPYSALGFSPDNKGADIGVSVTTINDPNLSVVDWVLLELREENAPDNILRSMSALVRRDGWIVDCSDGTSPVTFRNVDPNLNYQVAVRHRNHLGIMTTTAVTVN